MTDYEFRQYYSDPHELTIAQAHELVDIAATTCGKYRIHKMLDSLHVDAVTAQKLNGEWRIFTGTLNICYLIESVTEEALKKIKAA
jgi:hypothetical protein